MSKPSTKADWKLPITLSVVHLILVFLVALSVISGGELEIWFFFLMLDFPVSIGLFPISDLLTPILSSYSTSDSVFFVVNPIKNFWLPLIYFGVTGTIWWFLLGFLIKN